MCGTHVDQTKRFRYENPFITATSRSVISDIYSLARQLCYVDIPKPLAMLYILFRLKPPDAKPGSRDSSWFQGMRVWTEIGDICESESFGEYTSRILFCLWINHWCRWSPEKYRRTHNQRSLPPWYTPRHQPLNSLCNLIILPFPNRPQPILNSPPNVSRPPNPPHFFDTPISFPTPSPTSHHDPIVLQRTRPYNTP